MITALLFVYVFGMGFTLCSNFVSGIGLWNGLLNMLAWPVIVPTMIVLELWRNRDVPKHHPYNPADYE